ncbi:MAG: lamin tail domain-containing protein [Bacteroidia bacterium]|nr:lamin tail domain-containing protein [Bacteroidia bacterium]
MNLINNIHSSRLFPKIIVSANFLMAFNCYNLFSQVVINEVMHYPSNPQGMVMTGREYVELYNTDPCNPIDISCYILGVKIDEGIVTNGGTIVIPQGTVIAPYSHLVIGTEYSY